MLRIFDFPRRTANTSIIDDHMNLAKLLFGVSYNIFPLSVIGNIKGASQYIETFLS